MRLVLFSHPNFFASQSMPRFAGMLKKSFESLGHQVEVWSPQACVFNWVPRGSLSKWAGYIDQYLLFPVWVRRALRKTTSDTLFVFCDQALGPWVPLVESRPNIVHVHDLLALRSALGEVPENPTSLTGRIYQKYIRRGFQHGRHFICVSEKTREDLVRVGRVNAALSDVVYNGINFPYAPLPSGEALDILRAADLEAPVLSRGMLLHVGGGQWYKNLPGVIALYAHYASITADPKPLWCVTPGPSPSIVAMLRTVPARGKVIFAKSLDSRALQALYSLASVLLFPSLAEGFGWPLVEAQACGCPVLTTDEPPMNEVAGPAAWYLPRLGTDCGSDACPAVGRRPLRKGGA
jgi:glycosyltransferase involved in cell wall biosynthesis